MKKLSLITAILLTVIFASSTEAKQFKSWINKTVWEEPNGWVYAVGKAKYTHQSTDEFLNSQQLATKVAIDNLKTYLNVNRLLEFQVIDFDYSQDTYYVLAAVPKLKNNPEAEKNRNHSNQNILMTQELLEDEETCIKKYSQNEDIFACEVQGRVFLYAVTTSVITEPGQIGLDKAYTIAKNKAVYKIKEFISEQYLANGDLNGFKPVIVEINQDTIRFIGGIPLDKNIGESFWG